MKYMITWRERPMGSAGEYEKAQKRILSVFRQWEPPEGFKILEFVVRVGDWGGVMLAETSDPLAIHNITSALAAFEFDVAQVVDVQDAVAAELEVIAWRDALPAD